MKSLIPLLSIALPVVGGVYWFLNPGRGPMEDVDPNEKAYVEQIDGRIVLHVKGSGYEMGFQQGALLRDHVVKATTGFEQLLGSFQLETGVPRVLLETALDLVYRLCERHIPERYRREMEGLADGSGADLKTIRRAQVVSVVTERGCSAFAVFGKATKDGKVYHGRNFDWVTDAGLQKMAVLILYEPDG
ncbi:MAG TPA: C45 family autoproteolytic acyltransferase/hydrolase, partial [Candidatus Hydrogenedentes bacterium]|nr:C45 family autoproteolytic acyltransferase/hydrolase [Candidatus Hydrogenedentota bacterium]